jgi:putative tricarboxylic transport membrane protein
VKREIIVSSFWLIFSFYVSFESYRLGLTTANRPGPGFFPCIAAIGIGLIAASRLINSVRVSAPDENFTLGTADETGLVLGVIAGMTAYAFLLDLLGFFLCTFLLVAFYLRLIAARRWTTALTFAAAVAFTSHLFFDVLLKAELPRGLLAWLS